jgi:transcriptional regulator with XRE-family HTH domain
MSYQEFADRIGCHKGFVSLLCTGRRVSMSEPLAERVITVLEIHPSQLFEDVVSPAGGHPDLASGSAA